MIDKEWITKTVGEIVAAQAKGKRIYALFSEKRTSETLDVLDQNLREIGVRMTIIPCGCNKNTKDLLFDILTVK